MPKHLIARIEVANYVCEHCGRVFGGNNVRLARKLLDKHYLKTHKTTEFREEEDYAFGDFKVQQIAGHKQTVIVGPLGKCLTKTTYG